MSGGVTSSYVYDADGNRVKETIAGVTLVFIGNYYELDNLIFVADEKNGLVVLRFGGDWNVE